MNVASHVIDHRVISLFQMVASSRRSRLGLHQIVMEMVMDRNLILSLEVPSAGVNFVAMCTNATYIKWKIIVRIFIWHGLARKRLSQNSTFLIKLKNWIFKNNKKNCIVFRFRLGNILQKYYNPSYYLVNKQKLTKKLRNTHDCSIDKPEKADFEKDLSCIINCVKVQPQLPGLPLWAEFSEF